MWTTVKECQHLPLYIIRTADGVIRFLLAQLHIDSLATKHTRNAVRKALSSLPQGLDDTYDAAMHRIHSQNDDDVDLAKRVLIWISYAKRPLTVGELQHAVAIVPMPTNINDGDITDEELLLSVCAGIVTIENESKIIRLVHYCRGFSGHDVKFEDSRGADHDVVRPAKSRACLFSSRGYSFNSPAVGLSRLRRQRGQTCEIPALAIQFP